MIRKTIVLLLALAAFACLPLHCFILPDTNQVKFLSWSYGNREQFLIRAVNFQLEFSTWSYFNASTTPLDFDIVFVSYHRIPLLPMTQPQKWFRGFSIPLIVCLPLFGAYPLMALIRVWRRRRRRKLGLCTECGYSLRGLTESRCPECSTKFDPSTMPSTSG